MREVLRERLLGEPPSQKYARTLLITGEDIDDARSSDVHVDLDEWCLDASTASGALKLAVAGVRRVAHCSRSGTELFAALPWGSRTVPVYKQWVPQWECLGIIEPVGCDWWC